MASFPLPLSPLINTLQVRGSHLRGNFHSPSPMGRCPNDSEPLFDGLYVHAFTPSFVSPLKPLSALVLSMNPPCCSRIRTRFNITRDQFISGRGKRSLRNCFQCALYHCSAPSISPTFEYRSTITTAFCVLRPNIWSGLRLLTPSIRTSCT